MGADHSHHQSHHDPPVSENHSPQRESHSHDGMMGFKFVDCEDCCENGTVTGMITDRLFSHEHHKAVIMGNPVSDMIAHKTLRKYSAEGKTVQLEQFLLLHKQLIQIDDADPEGNSALHMAARQGHLRICRILLQHGATPELRNTQGQTPERLADAQGHSDCRILLQSRFGDGLEAQQKRDLPIPGVCMEGYLDQRGEAGWNLSQGIQKRYFVLKEEKLQFFADQIAYKMRHREQGEILLKRAVLAAHTDPERQAAFSIFDQTHSRQYVLAAQVGRQRHEWERAIQERIDALSEELVNAQNSSSPASAPPIPGYSELTHPVSGTKPASGAVRPFKVEGLVIFPAIHEKL